MSLTRTPTIYRVLHRKTGWEVVCNGHPIEQFSLKRSAIAAAREYAQGHPTARVIVHYADEAVESEALFHGEPRPARPAVRRSTSR